MHKMFLPDELKIKYKELKPRIKKRLKEFEQVPKKDYFYELCFCLCTPQSRARNAFEVQTKLMKADFYNKPFDPIDLLRSPEHYIRFHNQKAKRLLDAVDYFPDILEILNSEDSPDEKRDRIHAGVNGFGWKESAHYLRNIGYKGLAILDRHILKHLVSCGVYEEIPNISSKKRYFQTEEKFKEFAEHIGIPIDELDILFWSYESGEILK